MASRQSTPMRPDWERRTKSLNQEGRSECFWNTQTLLLLRKLSATAGAIQLEQGERPACLKSMTEI